MKKHILLFGFIIVGLVLSFCFFKKNKKNAEAENSIDDDKNVNIDLSYQKEKTTNDIIQRHKEASSLIRDSINNIMDETDKIDDSSFEQMNNDLEDLL